MSDSNSGSDLGAFLAGFVIGGLVGAAVALILAPQSGEDTRNQLRQQGDELRSRATQSSNSTGDYLATARDRLQVTGTDVQNRARIVLDTGKARVTGTPSPSSRMMTSDDQTDEDESES